MRRGKYFRKVANPILRVVFHLLYDLEVSGREHVPKQGPFILAMNHIYFVDPVLEAVLSPRHVVIMSKIENYGNPLQAALLHLYDTFPVHRGELDLTSIRTSLEVLQEGHGLLIAPEGTRSRVGQLQPGLDGMVWLALKSGTPIVLVAHSGQEQLGHCLRRLRRAPVRVAFGEPFRVVAPAGKATREQMNQMTQEAMYRLAALLPERYRGVYADLDRATSSFLQPCQG